MTDNELYSMFITVGPIVSAKIMRDRSSGYSYGYGFVHFQLPDDAAKAIATLNGLQVSNKRIKVSYSRPNTADIKDTNLYVGNVPQVRRAVAGRSRLDYLGGTLQHVEVVYWG